MAATDKCATCKFFNPNGTCHQQSPPPQKASETVQIVWPEVKRTDWCGQFVAGPYKG